MIPIYHGKGFEQFEIHTGGGSGVNGIRFIPVYRPKTLYADGRLTRMYVT
jgi:hypothetical protein